jgi:hypothetical protein
MVMAGPIFRPRHIVCEHGQQAEWRQCEGVFPSGMHLHNAFDVSCGVTHRTTFGGDARKLSVEAASFSLDRSGNREAKRRSLIVDMARARGFEERYHVSGIDRFGEHAINAERVGLSRETLGGKRRHENQLARRS